MVDLVAGNFVQITIDGTDRTDYVISYNRYSSLCELGDSYELVLSSDYPAALDPYQSIIITEWYDGASDVVLRGYILSIDQEFEGEFRIVGQDKSILLFDYFIPTQVKSKGESVDYWIQWYVDQVGLTIEFQATSANAIVEIDTPMGLQTAGQGILTLERLAAYYIRFDSDQDKLIAYRLGSSQPAITINDVEEAKRTLGTEKTRNVVKVYGGYKYSLIPGEPVERILARASSVVPGLLVDKTVVVNSPGLRKQTYVDIVADRILNTVNSIDDIQLYSVPELIPDLEVGQVAYINVSYSPHIVYEGDRKITSIETSVGEQGATTIIGVGEKCARVSIEFPIPPVYATTDKDGVAVSFDGGDNFNPSNTGLAGSGLSGLNIAANGYGRQMVLTDDGLYRRFSSLGAWAGIPGNLGDPVNSAGDSPAPSISGASPITIARVVDEPTNIDRFHVMATWLNSDNKWRTWVYTTKDFGSTWNSNAIFTTNDPELGPRYNFRGLDIKVPLTNNVYVLGDLTDLRVESLYWTDRTYTGSHHWGAGYWDAASGIVKTGDFDPTAGGGGVFPYIFSIPNNRNIAYAILIERNGDTNVEVHRTMDGGKTWNHILSESVEISISPLTIRPLLDPGSLGVTSGGVVRFALCAASYIESDEDPPFKGRALYFIAKAYFITDNFDGDAVGTMAYDNVGFYFTTHTAFLGDHDWQTQEKITSEKWATTYNLNSDNAAYFGRIVYQELDDIGQETVPYKPEYDFMHILLWRANFQSYTVSPSLDIPFYPAFDWFHTIGANKWPYGSFSSSVLARSSTAIYTYVRQEYIDDVDHKVYRNSTVIWNSSDDELFLHSGTRAAGGTNTIAIIQNISAGDKFYLDNDGTLSPPVENFESTSSRYAFHLNGINYWTNILSSGGSAYLNYYEAPGGSRLDLEKIYGPELSQWGIGLAHPRGVSIRTYD